MTSQTSDFPIMMTPLCNDITAVRRDQETGDESSDSANDTRPTSVVNSHVLCVCREGRQEAELEQQEETNDGPTHVDLDVGLGVDLNVNLHVDLDLDQDVDLDLDLDFDLNVDLHIDRFRQI